MIGLGILRTPGEIARSVQDPWWYLALWAGGGLFVLVSTLVVVELMALTPRSGGLYAMISRAFGPYPGFLLGWTDWVAACAAAALKAVVLAEYAAQLVPGLAPYGLPLALAVNGAFALLQLGGVRVSGGVLQAAAALFALILLVVSVALVLGEGGETSATLPLVVGSAPGWAGYGVVAAAIVFTYDGWIAASYYSGEVKGGSGTSASGSIRGVLLVIALYLLLNAALVFNVPLAELEGQELALAAALDFLYGPGAGSWIVLAALLILLAHQNVQYMAASRVLYALSVDGLGSRRATGVSRRGTPTGAVLVSWLLMTGLILLGGFEFLLNMTTLLFIAGYVALLVGVFRMRRLDADAERPVRAWGFPLSGYVCVALWVAVGLLIAVLDLRSAAWGLALAALSVPAFLWLKTRRGIAAGVRRA